MTDQLNEEDLEIIKHREAHFSGSFPAMVEYYQAKREPEFPLERMVELDALEKSHGSSLALILSEEDLEEIDRAQKFYKKLKKTAKKGSLEELMRDLLLSEEPETAIESIVRTGKKAVPMLIALMQNEDLKSPLFPGRGQATALSLECLRRLKDDSAMIALFEEIGHEDVIDEEGALLALKAIGNPAMEFLLKIVSSLPITGDNERAAVALIHFKDEERVAKEALHLLEDKEFREASPLSSYLALIAAGVRDKHLQETFKALGRDASTPKALRDEIRLIMK